MVRTFNINNCDSTATLNLTINNSTFSSEDITACDDYEWNSITYTESGIYTFNTTNSLGCDSTEFNINNSLNCNSYQQRAFNTTNSYCDSDDVTINTSDSFDWNGVT